MSEQKSSMILLGAAVGDIVGSRFEWHPTKSEAFEFLHPHCHFTDDSVLTLAVAKAVMDGKDYQQKILQFAQLYPDAGYGGRFRDWLKAGGGKGYHSFGNGSSMRASAVGWAFDDEDEVLLEAEASAAVTHNHPEGIKGAQATALAILLARKGVSKEAIKHRIEQKFEYDLDFTLDDIREGYRFDATCQGTVPAALVAFFESQNYKDAIRKAIALGGDADTLAAIAGAIAEAYYGGVPVWLEKEVKHILGPHLWSVIESFNKTFPKKP